MANTTQTHETRITPAAQQTNNAHYQRSKGHLLPVLALLGATAMWGSTFAMQKDVFTRMDVFDFLAIRFAIAGVVAGIVFFSQLRKASKGTWIRGSLLGLAYAAAQDVQALGLNVTTASVTGFLTGLYVVFTPILVFLMFKVRQSVRVWLAVALGLCGLASISLTGDSGSFLGIAIGFGEFLVIISAILYAIHVVFAERFVARSEPIALTAIQMIVLGVVCVAVAIPDGIQIPSGDASFHDWAVIVYMALGSGIASMLLQMWAQARLTATKAALLMTGEPVFAALFAVILISEPLTPRVIVGGALIVGAMVLSQVDIRKYAWRSSS